MVFRSDLKGMPATHRRNVRKWRWEKWRGVVLTVVIIVLLFVLMTWLGSCVAPGPGDDMGALK